MEKRPLWEHATRSRKRYKQIMKMCAPARERAARSRKRQKIMKMYAPARRHTATSRPKTCHEINLQSSPFDETLRALSYGP